MYFQNNTNVQTRIQKASYCEKFNECRIEKNQFGFSQDQPNFEQVLNNNHLKNSNLVKQVEKHKQIKQNIPQIKPISIFINQGIHQKSQTKKCSQHPSQRKILQDVKFNEQQNLQQRLLIKKDNQSVFESEQQDFTDIWNQLSLNKQKQTCQQHLEQKKINQSNVIQNSKKTKQQQKFKLQHWESSQQSPSCQLTQQQMLQWVKSCNEQKSSQNCQKQMLNTDLNYKIMEINTFQQKNQDLQQQIIQQFQDKNIKNNENVFNKEKMEQQQQDFVILDNLPIDTWRKSIRLEKQANEESGNNKQIQLFKEDQKYMKNGPFSFNTQTYEIHKKFNIKFIHRLSEKQSNQSSSKNNFQQNKKLRPLRKINWQINQQKKPEVKQMRSKRSCRMTLIQQGVDFLIFDHAKFLIQPIRDQTHTYFGLKAIGNFTGLNLQESSENLSQSEIFIKKYLKQYLYLPSTGQCLLQTNYSQTNGVISQANIRKFNVNLCLTNEKVAECQRFVFNQQKDKKQIIQVKIYDKFEQKAMHYAGIVESKISNFSQQWYCDTNVYIPKRKQLSNKNTKNWEKFRIQLRLSETGSIVAQLGIFDAQSSVTNCILYNQNKMSQFMMGTMVEDNQQINYIVRIAGMSPLMGFITALSRKIFVVSS